MACALALVLMHIVAVLCVLAVTYVGSGDFGFDLYLWYWFLI